MGSVYGCWCYLVPAQKADTATDIEGLAFLYQAGKCSDFMVVSALLVLMTNFN